MFSRLFNQKKRTVDSNLFVEMPKYPKNAFSPLIYNWILSHRLAIGPMPRTDSHWKQLEDEGFRNRFSCCYPHEHIFTPIPETWNTREISLPDHRQQSKLDKTRLILALNQAEDMLTNYSGPLYLHCFAGQERSALIAIGLVSIVEKKDLFESIYFVKQCHKTAKPLYDQLDLLENVLKERFD
jgi:hypothetical protein